MRRRFKPYWSFQSLRYASPYVHPAGCRSGGPVEGLGWDVWICRTTKAWDYWYPGSLSYDMHGMTALPLSAEISMVLGPGTMIERPDDDLRDWCCVFWAYFIQPCEIFLSRTTKLNRIKQFSFSLELPKLRDLPVGKASHVIAKQGRQSV